MATPPTVADGVASTELRPPELPIPRLPISLLPTMPEPAIPRSHLTTPQPVGAPIHEVDVVASAIPAEAPEAPKAPSAGGAPVRAAKSGASTAGAAAPAGPVVLTAGKTATNGLLPRAKAAEAIAAKVQPTRTPSSSAASAGHRVTRTVYARVGDDITIALGGEGWTFTGGGTSGDAWKSGVQYESRTADAKGTTFVFKAKALGAWRLDFQQQNTGSGAATGETIDLRVLTDTQFAARLAAGRTGATGSSSGNSAQSGTLGSHVTGDLASADWLLKEGKYSQALDAYEKVWQSGNPALADKIASLAYRIGRYKDAHDYWQRNFSLAGTLYQQLAVVGLMKTATAQKDAPELRALFDSVHELHGVSMRESLLGAARYLYDAKKWAVALRYLDEYVKRYNGQEGIDAAYYLLGEIYQGDTPMQDARKALTYFQDIVSKYPTSDYYERARSAIIYLNRHFFEIR